MIIRENFEKLYCNKLERLVYFLGVYNLPKLSQEDMNHLKRTVINNEIETVIVSPDDSLLNSTRPLKKN
jgi:hypothetical protein